MLKRTLKLVMSSRGSECHAVNIYSHSPGDTGEREGNIIKMQDISMSTVSRNLVT